MLKVLTKRLIAASVSISFLACNLGGDKQKTLNTKEFEGIITYHEIIKDRDSSLNLNDTVLLFYSNGNFVRVHSDISQKIHLVKDYYFADKSLRLLLFSNSDTLHQLDLNFPAEKLGHFSVNEAKDRIFSRKCEEIDLSTSYPENDSTTYTDFSFIFSKGYLPVNKEHFENWHLGFFNKVIAEAGAFYLKFKAVHFDSTHKSILSSKTYDIISVKPQAIDPKIFDVDATQDRRLKIK